MKVRVKLFAVAKELAGTNAIEIELGSDRTIADLRASLAAYCPPLAQIIPHCRFAINSVYVLDGALVEPNAEIACIPPVSGG